MKRMNVMITIILMAFLAGNSNLNAQRGMRGLMRDSLRISKSDTTGMNWMRMHNGPMFDRYQMYGMGRMRNAPGWRGLSRPGPMGRWSDDFRPGPGRRGIYPMPPAYSK